MVHALDLAANSRHRQSRSNRIQVVMPMHPSEITSSGGWATILQPAHRCAFKHDQTDCHSPCLAAAMHELIVLNQSMDRARHRDADAYAACLQLSAACCRQARRPPLLHQIYRAQPALHATASAPRINWDSQYLCHRRPTSQHMASCACHCRSADPRHEQYCESCGSMHTTWALLPALWLGTCSSERAWLLSCVNLPQRIHFVARACASGWCAPHVETATLQGCQSV